MVDGPIKVRALFATPFGELRLRNCEPLNRDLEALFLQRETEEYRNPSPSHVPQLETFESRFNLFRWTESCVQQLRSFMLNAVAQMVIETTSLTPQDIAKLSFPSCCTITRWHPGPACTACVPVKVFRNTRTAACCDSSTSGRAPTPIWIPRTRPCSAHMRSRRWN
jgi:hypothetical protein